MSGQALALPAPRRAARPASLLRLTWAFPSAVPLSGRTPVGTGPAEVKSDGADLWVADFTSGDVKQVRASTGVVVGTWTGATNALGVLVARGRIFVTGFLNPGRLYTINPTTASGPVGVVSSILGNQPFDVTTDGTFIWTANGASVSKVDPDTGAATTVTTGFNEPLGIVFDGDSVWLTDRGDKMLKKLNAAGNVIMQVAVGSVPSFPVFDGSNIWVPNQSSNSVTVVRARDGAVLATLTGNGLNDPVHAAFDGQFILVTNHGISDSVSLWKAADLTPVGTFATGANTGPEGACSDGINFWITLNSANQLARF